MKTSRALASVCDVQRGLRALQGILGPGNRLKGVLLHRAKQFLSAAEGPHVAAVDNDFACGEAFMAADTDPPPPRGARGRAAVDDAIKPAAAARTWDAFATRPALAYASALAAGIAIGAYIGWRQFF